MNKQLGVILLDVGGSSLKANYCLINDGKTQYILNQPEIIEIDASGSKEQILTDFCNNIDYVLALSRFSLEDNDLPFDGVSLAFPGPCDYEIGIPYLEGLSKYDSLYGVRFLDELKKSLVGNGYTQDLYFTMQNDARLYALGNFMMNYDILSKYDRIINIMLGTGCGSAFIVNHELLTDDAQENLANGIPEDGYIYHLPFDGKIVDDVFSSRGVLEVAKEKDLNCESVKDVAMLASQGNEKALEVFRTFGKKIEELLNCTLASFRPDACVIGGNISKAANWMSIQSVLPILISHDPVLPLVGAANYWMKKVGISNNCLRLKSQF